MPSVCQRIAKSGDIFHDSVAYGMEETDVSLQLFAAGWDIYHAGRLRVFHDTDLAHHDSPEIVSGYVANVGLFAFLNYPVVGWYWDSCRW